MAAGVSQDLRVKTQAEVLKRRLLQEKIQRKKKKPCSFCYRLNLY